MNVPNILSGPTGPYEHGYLMVRVKYADGQIKMITYQKYVYEKNNGKLPKGWDVHHINEDKTDNYINNLEAKTRNRHTSDHMSVGEEMYFGICPQCGDDFVRAMRDVRHNNENNGKDGPFCGKRCAGRWNRQRQYERDQRRLRRSL